MKSSKPAAELTPEDIRALPEVRGAARQKWLEMHGRVLGRLMLVDAVVGELVGRASDRLNERLLASFGRHNWKGPAEEKARERRIAIERKLNAIHEEAAREHPAYADAVERQNRADQEAIWQANAWQLADSRRAMVENIRSRNAGWLVSALPKRPWKPGEEGFTGAYSDLARETLVSSLAGRDETGTVPLLGRDVTQEHRMAARSAGIPPEGFARSEREYNSGVAALLCEAGFVELTEGEQGIPYGKGRFNDAIRWSNEDQTLRASLPFNPDNELHRTLAAEDAHPSHIAITMPHAQDYVEPRFRQPAYLNIQAVTIAEPAMALSQAA